MSEKLGDLFNHYGTDKTKKHGYDSVYEKFFEPIRYDQLNSLRDDIKYIMSERVKAV